jgi:hypothetical protein
MEIHRIESGPHGHSQFRNPSSVHNKRFAQQSDIDINHGWKIHADIVSGLDQDQAFARMGRNHSGAIIDTKAAESFDADLARLGISYDDFEKGFFDYNFGAGKVGRNEYMDPVGAVKSMGVMQDQGIQYKLSGGYGSGRQLTAYPQSLEKRDALIAGLEEQVGHLLVDQNDPTFRLGLQMVGTKNTPLSQKVSGRFTTDYVDTKADGTPDFTNSARGTGLPEFTITGSVSENEAQTINRVIQAEPRFAELLHGSSGYKSPYRTIEDVFRDRSSPTGYINPTQRAFGIDEDIVYGASSYGSRKPEPIKTKIVKSADEVSKKVISPEPVITAVEETKSAPAPKAVIETTKSGRPIIKVGTPIKTEEAPPKVEEEPKKKTTLKAGKPIDEVKTATPVKNIAEETGEVIKDVTEVLTSGEKAEEKVYEKSEEKLDEKAEKAREKLLEAVVEGEKKNARMLSAAGKAPVDSAFKKKIVSGITEVTGKTPGRTTMEVLNAAEGLSRGVLTAMKDGKNLRLAGTAALLSVAGFAVGKKRDGINKQTDAPMDVDRESALRRSLMSDG